jgi:hypothetical protein
MPKDRHATPIFKIHLNKIKAFRGTFKKVRKTGEEEAILKLVDEKIRSG